MYLAYGPEHYQIARDILGQEGVDLMLRCPLAMAGDGRARVDFDETWAVVRHTEESLRDPLVVAHEFGHLWHVTAYPKLSLEAPTYRCEAVAHMFEAVLAKKHPQIMRRAFDRLRLWDVRARAVLDNLPVEEEIDVKRWAFPVLAGRYG